MFELCICEGKGERTQWLRMSPSSTCFGVRAGTLLKIFGLLSFLNSVLMLGAYEAYKANYWHKSTSYAQFHANRVESSRYLYNQTLAATMAVLDERSADEKQQLLAIMGNEQNHTKVQEAVARLTAELDADKRNLRDVQQQLLDQGIGQNEEEYSPLTSYAFYDFNYKTPFDILFWVCQVSIFFSMLGIYGVVCANGGLIKSYLIFNLMHLSASFTFILDILVTAHRRDLDETMKLRSKVSVYEGTIIFSFLAAFAIDIIVAGVSFKALTEAKEKKRGGGAVGDHEYAAVLNYQL